MPGVKNVLHRLEAVLKQAAHISAVNDVARVINPKGKNRVVLVCEHASHHIPAEFNHLGLSVDHLRSHIAWDPGALEIAQRMAELLNAPLVYSDVSRLVYDCNRPPEAESAMPAQSEVFDIPGYQNLSDLERQSRTDTYYRPFEQLLSDTLEGHSTKPVLVTIHSFTPVYRGMKRDVEIGILHDEDSRLAHAMLDQAEGYETQLNKPYGPEHGVTHTLQRHALSKSRLNVMLEIRSDLIGTSVQCKAKAEKLVVWLNEALLQLDAQAAKKRAEG